jgi:hypothetical protein
MSYLASLSDLDLLEKLEASREAAHNAPMAGISQAHTGERGIFEHAHGWYHRSREYGQFLAEAQRRGLK